MVVLMGSHWRSMMFITKLLKVSTKMKMNQTKDSHGLRVMYFLYHKWWSSRGSSWSGSRGKQIRQELKPSEKERKSVTKFEKQERMRSWVRWEDWLIGQWISITSERVLKGQFHENSIVFLSTQAVGNKYLILPLFVLVVNTWYSSGNASEKCGREIMELLLLLSWGYYWQYIYTSSSCSWLECIQHSFLLF